MVDWNTTIDGILSWRKLPEFECTIIAKGGGLIVLIGDKSQIFSIPMSVKKVWRILDQMIEENE